MSKRIYLNMLLNKLKNHKEPPLVSILFYRIYVKFLVRKSFMIEI